MEDADHRVDRLGLRWQQGGSQDDFHLSSSGSPHGVHSEQSTPRLQARPNRSASVCSGD